MSDSDLLAFIERHPWWTTIWLIIFAGLPVRFVLALRGKTEETAKQDAAPRVVLSVEKTAAEMTAEAMTRCHDSRCPGRLKKNHRCHNLDCKEHHGPKARA
jgi:hypothetical protein